MKKELFTLLKHGSVYAAGIIIGRLVGFIMIPVYTRYLTPSDYGTLEILSLTIDFISIIIGAGIANAMFRYYYKYTDISEKREVVSTGFILVAVIFTVAFGFLYNLSPFISMIFFNSKTYKLYIDLMLFVMLLSAGFEIPMAFLRIKQRSIAFVSISLIRLIMMLALNIYFLIILRMGIEGVLYSNIITSIISSTYLTLTTLRNVGLRFSISKAKEILKYGFPIILATLSAFVMRFSDRYFIQFINGLDEVGIYSLGYKFGFIMTMLVITPFDSIWSAQKFEIANQENAKQIFSSVFTIFNVVLFTVGGLICVGIKETIMILSDKSYWEAYQIVPCLVISNIFYGWFIFTNIGLHIAYKTKYMGYNGILLIILDLLMNFLTIPIIGMYGAAISITIAFFLRFILIYYYSNKFYPIQYEWPRILGFMFFIVVTVFLLSFITSPWLIITLLLKSSLFILVALILSLLIMVKPYERTLLSKIISIPDLE